MKKALLLIAISLCLATPSYAAEEKSIALKIGAPGSIMFESAVTDNLSVGVEIAGARYYPEASSYTLINNGGFVNSRAVGARAVWQPKGAFKKGAYLAGWADYLIFDYDNYGGSSGMNNVSSTGSGTTFAAGIIIGYQYLMDDDLILSFGAGYGFIKGTNVDTTQTTTTYDTAGNSISSTSTPSTANINSSDAFLFDLYIGYLF